MFIALIQGGLRKRAEGFALILLLLTLLVSRERITARPLAFYQKLMGIVEESRYAKAGDP